MSRSAMDEELFRDGISQWSHRLGKVIRSVKLRYSTAFSSDKLIWLYGGMELAISTLMALQRIF
jgi:hypothetical protein